MEFQRKICQKFKKETDDYVAAAKFKTLKL